VRVSESVGEEETQIIEACEYQGMPGWALAKGINIYLFKLNMILLGSDMKIHNLAHEYAHYVQLKYDHMDEREFSMDYPEQEAVNIQNYFREPFN
jgi:Zn-dependent peptidase ImmA (M78 family)